MFSGRTILLFFLALVFALLAVFIAQRWVASLAGRPAAPVASARVVVARMDIAQWQKVEAAQVELADWPKGAVTQDLFTEIGQVVGKVAVDKVFKGEALHARRVLDPKGGNVFSLSIPENKRAFTVRVNDVSGVAGFLLRDNHVDVLASRKVSGAKGDEVRTETLIQDLKVLAVDQESSNDKNKPTVVRSVTLEMTPDQAEQAFRAVEEGSIQLALRNPVDQNQVEPRAVAGAAPAIAPVPPPPPPEPRAAAPSGRTFTVIRGPHAISTVRCLGSECAEQPY
jgi:pilus assembly protein CpaB